MKIGPITIGASSDPRVQQLAEAVSLSDNLAELLQERIADLELALEDAGWQRALGAGEQEFTRDGLRRICALSRLNFLKNPLIGRGVLLQAAYVFGQGMSIQSEDRETNTIIQAFLDNPANQEELTSHEARMLKEQDLAVLGNLFFVFFTAVNGDVTIRTIDADEVEDIICNPEDARERWFYKRVWTTRAIDLATGTIRGERKTAYYPDWRYNPKDGSRVTTIGGDPVMWESPVKHVKVGGLSSMRFGVPETYRAIDWAKAYKEFLEDRATVGRALSRFAWSLTSSGGPRGVQAAKARLSSTLGTGGQESNPGPLPGSTFIGAGDSKLQAMNVAGATINPDEGRRFLLMVCSATGLPETFFGDVSVGTLATAKSLDRPTELKFRDRQTLWADTFKDILGYAVQRKRGGSSGGVISDEVRAVQIDVDFPALLEHDVAETVSAIVAAATLDGKAPAGTITGEQLVRLLLTALGVDDVDEIVAGMTDQIARLDEPPEPEPAPGAEDDEEGPTAEAYRGLQEAIRQLGEAAKA